MSLAAWPHLLPRSLYPSTQHDSPRPLQQPILQTKAQEQMSCNCSNHATIATRREEHLSPESRVQSPVCYIIQYVISSPFHPTLLSKSVQSSRYAQKPKQIHPEKKSVEREQSTIAFRRFPRVATQLLLRCTG